MESRQQLQTKNVSVVLNKKSEMCISEKVKVADLLTRNDLKYMKAQSIALIAVLMNGERYMVSKQYTIPKTAEIQRDTQGEVTGMRAVASG